MGEVEVEVVKEEPAVEEIPTTEELVGKTEDDNVPF